MLYSQVMVVAAVAVAVAVAVTVAVALAVQTPVMAVSKRQEAKLKAELTKGVLDVW